MDDSEDASSTISQHIDSSMIVDLTELVEDFTGEDDLLSSHSSPASLCLSDGTPNIKTRAYQLEMLEESLARNIIVAVSARVFWWSYANVWEMDTGSGKTHIAVLRMMHELERMPSYQRIWFLAPKVALCYQQFEYIRTQISAVQVKNFAGADGVDGWTQSHWNSVLKNVKIVVSTHQILLNALSNAFVKIESLALIVFDEAHDCIGKSPGAKIMKSFYEPRKSRGLVVPFILGLTASPVMKSDTHSLETIENTLDSLCRTPTAHRAELRLQVQLPILSQVFYQTPPPKSSLSGSTKTIQSLGQAARELRITEDPYVLALSRDDSEKSKSELKRVYKSHRTWSQDEMLSLHSTSLHIATNLGAYSADYFISEVVSKFIARVDKDDCYLSDQGRIVSPVERRYLAAALRRVEINSTANINPVSVSLTSDKVNKLIQTLLAEPPGFAGIIFVKERIVVAILAHLLSVHPMTRGRFRIGEFVGSSESAKRRRKIGEIVNVEAQKHTLSLFKAGIINIVISTNVLEEGIDVPACNLVICFEKPENLKSFIQRRGRARKVDSKLILLLDPKIDKMQDWAQLESAMKQQYEDEMRVLKEKLLLEDEEVDGDDAREFRVDSTGALLDLDNAVQRLYHFCATLPRTDYVDLRPEFMCFEAGQSLVRARLVLPVSVDKAVRTAESRTSWKSEKNAIKDAAFEAYMALYRAGLVNQNLLPLLRHDPAEITSSAVETRTPLMVVNDQLNPWVHIAQLWTIGQEFRRSTIYLDELKMLTYLPSQLPYMRPFQHYWNPETIIHITVKSDSTAIPRAELPGVIQQTWSLLQASFGTRFPVQKQQHVVLFSPNGPTVLQDLLGHHDIEHDKQTFTGLIRDRSEMNVSYLLKGRLPSRPPKELVQRPHKEYEDFPLNAPHLSLTLLPRRFDYIHKISSKKQSRSEKPHSVVLPTSRCIMDDIPFPYVQFGLLIPSIMRRFEIYLLAEELSATVLKNVDIQDTSLIVTAISASSANEESNYQRLEFIGDSILKLCTSVQLTAEYPQWHEGYLSAMKDRFVSNARLSRAAAESGLDKYIVTKAFTGHKWRPSYVDDLLKLSDNSTRLMSSKVLADVVEALIGAATLDGGLPKALKCLQVFLPEMQWQSLEMRQSFLFQRAPVVDLPPILEPLETLLGYTFRKKSLLVESMTHASCNIGTGSLERFEFLGDGILDNLMVSAMQEQNVELSHVQMHLFRSALVNADFLAFLCMEWAVQQERTDIVEVRPTVNEPNNTATSFVTNTTTASLPLWSFMRHHSPRLGIVQVETAIRYTELRAEINAAIQRGTHYPWALLSRLQALKFYSDLVESVLGAIWIDSGSFEICRNLTERIGILPYLRRILADKVHLWHPKEELGQLAGNETVKYVVGFVHPEEELGRLADAGMVNGIVKAPDDRLADKKYWCKVFVGGDEIAKVNDGVNKIEAQTRAAERAVWVWKARRRKEHISDEAVAAEAIKLEQRHDVYVDADMMMDV